MKASQLANLRGKIPNANRLKIEIAKAVNTGMVYAKRGNGYSDAAQAVSDMLASAVGLNRSWTRSASISATPTTATVSVAGVRTAITVEATWADAGTEVLVSPATGTLAFGAAAANNSTVTIGDRVYTFKTTLSSAPAVANEVLIGANATASATNLASAINATGGAGTTYGTGTAQHAEVSATLSSATVTVTSRGGNPQENSLALLKSATQPALSGATLSGGKFDKRVTFVSGTPAAATVNTYGRVTYVADGSSTVTVSFQGRTDTVAITADSTP